MSLLHPDLPIRRRVICGQGKKGPRYFTRERTPAEVAYLNRYGKHHPSTEDNDALALAEVEAALARRQQ